MNISGALINQNPSSGRRLPPPPSLTRDHHGGLPKDTFVQSSSTQLPTGPTMPKSMHEFKASASHVHSHSEQVQTNDPIRRRRLLQAMLPEGISKAQFADWSRALESYDLDQLERLQKGGVKMKLTSKSDAAEYRRRAGEKSKIPAGHYLSDTKTLYLKKSTLRGKLASDVVGHELGHAVDDIRERDNTSSDRTRNKVKKALGMRGRGNLQSQNDKEFRKLFEGYVERTEGLEKQGDGAMWTKYGRSSASEYYAEGTGLYYGGQEQRELLRKKDPALFKYLAAQDGV